MRVHLLGLPHFPTTRNYSFCAYTQKTRKLANMLASVGIDVILYGAAEAEVDERVRFIPVITPDELEEWFGHRDWTVDVFNEFDPAEPWWQTFNQRASAMLAELGEPTDICGITMGTSQKPVADVACSLGMLPVEVGVGYSGVFAPYRVYESWAWRNYITGKYGASDDMRAFDTVIPNFFEADQFPFGTGSGGYCLYLGRLTERKGPYIAALACQRLGVPLIVAGQGHMDLPGDVEYRGTVGPVQRAALLGSATAVFCPSQYLEPFCGVSVEAQMCGTPVIAANWGALVENVSEGSGFLCDTLADYVAGAELAPSLDRASIRKNAVEKWSTDVLCYDYARYLTKLQSLYGDGWYA